MKYDRTEGAPASRPSQLRGTPKHLYSLVACLMDTDGKRHFYFTEGNSLLLASAAYEGQVRMFQSDTGFMAWAVTMYESIAPFSIRRRHASKGVVPGMPPEDFDILQAQNLAVRLFMEEKEMLDPMLGEPPEPGGRCKLVITRQIGGDRPCGTEIHLPSETIGITLLNTLEKRFKEENAGYWALELYCSKGVQVLASGGDDGPGGYPHGRQGNR